MTSRKVIFLVGLMAVFGCIAAFGQTATSTLSGTVRDEAGGVVPGVTITIKNNATGGVRTVKTDAEGRYNLPNLDPGEYGLRAEAAGYKVGVHNRITLLVGGVTGLDVVLYVGAVSDTVVVEAQAPLIEPSKVEVSRVIETQEIEALPNIGRNFVDFVKLSSGVAPGRENIGGGPFKEPDAGVGASAAPRLAFGGQSELYTLIQVDGADNIQTYTGLPRATPSQEAAREFRVLNSSYLAEYGRALGGFVNIVTKSGTNDVHGSAYYFGLNDALNARSILNPPDADVLRQNQYGATLGGPIKKNRAFYFANYEGQRRGESNRFSQVIQSNLAGINAARARFGLTPEVLDQLRSNDYDQVLGKIDYHLGDNHSFAVRYNLLNSETENFLGGGGRASPASSTARNNHTRDQAVVLSAISILSPMAVNEARFQFARRTFDFQSVLAEPDLEVSNLLITGKSTSDADYYAEDRVQLAENLSMTWGAHQVKAGFDYNRLSNDAQWNLFFPARIIFPTMPALLNFTPTSTAGPVNFWWPVLATDPVHPGFALPFQNSVPPAWQDATLFQMTHSAYGFFAQDQWKANKKLTLTYGLRYDLEQYPRRYVAEMDMNNLQPRVGLAYAMTNKRVIRAGFGIFNDRLASSVGQVFTAAEWSSRGDRPNASLLYPGVADVPGRFLQLNALGPLAPQATINFLTTGQPPAGGVTSLTDNVSSHLRTPYSTQTSVQVSQEIGNGLALSASYLYVHGVKLIGHTGNYNATPPPPTSPQTLPSGKPIISGRQFAELGNFVVITNLGSSIYHGGTFEAEKRFSRGLSFHGSYTFSKTIANVDSITNLADFPEGLSLDAERGLSRQHVGHRFTFSGLGEIPKSVPGLRNFKLSSLVSIESGRPFNIFSGRDANGDGNPNSDRPGLIGRNTWMGPGYASVDFRVARPVKFNERLSAEFSMDFFNLFNRVNIRDLNTVYGADDFNSAPIASFNTPRDVFNPRQLQFGLKLKF
ncbi:MAG TPA: carboxypeptidase regulatory-like domain-containing protein [Blastocatellia bacterium]|nr:carboxypeptidase regulatory-like domain-containing protein [Blastocatellia bacterium]